MSDFGRDSYFQTVGYVTNDAILYPGSLIENLTNFQADTEGDAITLCEKLGILEKIEKLPHGFKTVIQSTEIPPLEQGAIQTIALIRSLVMAPKVLLLHKADAGLDLAKQKLLVEYLLSQKDLTVIADAATASLKEACMPLDLAKECKEVKYA